MHNSPLTVALQGHILPQALQGTPWNPEATTVEKPRDVIERIGLRRTAHRDTMNVAGIIFTYQCTIACRHCLFACRPERPHLVMPQADCLEYLRAFDHFPRVVHIAGGECFIFYDQMLALCREAHRQGIAPHFVESNSSWCTSDEIVERRFAELRDAGIQGMLLSCDPYHQEFVPAERVQRSYRIAVEMFGERNVMANADAIARADQLEGITRDEQQLRDHVRQAPPGWMAGNASKYLAKYLDKKPVEAFADVRCPDQFDLETTWEFHFDPYGNLQTNCGVALGNARRTPPLELLDQRRIAANPVVKVLAESGPVGLMELAMGKGFVPRDGYVQKCELCYHVRTFLRPHFPDILCPDEIYWP